MHGLINRSIQCFIRDTYGVAAWEDTARSVDLVPEGFEAMLTYEDQLTLDILNAASRLLDKSEEMILEDVGTFLVSHPNTEAVRRLLRFGGETFTEFLHSLDDLPDRARLAVPDLALPGLEVSQEEAGQFDLRVSGAHPGFAYVMIGVLRAMADDFGALVLLEPARFDEGGAMAIRISLLDSAFAKGRSFSLAGPSSLAGGRTT